MSPPSKAEVLVLRTPLATHDSVETIQAKTLIAALRKRVAVTEISLMNETITEEEWDKVMDAILDHERCITL